MSLSFETDANSCKKLNYFEISVRVRSNILTTRLQIKKIITNITVCPAILY
jgi:hypothetical protein